jgi:hypothetical protein
MKRLIAIAVSAGVCGSLIVACSVKKPSDSSNAAHILRQVEPNWDDGIRSSNRVPDVTRFGGCGSDPRCP